MTYENVIKISYIIEKEFVIYSEFPDQAIEEAINTGWNELENINYGQVVNAQVESHFINDPVIHVG